MHKGYTKRWRKRWDKSYHLDPYLWLLMDYFIDYANYKDSEVFFPDIGVIPLKRGQHIFGTRKLSEFLRVDRGVIRRKLKILKNIGFLTLQTTHQYTIATIQNYNIYQQQEVNDDPPNDQETTHPRPADDPQTTTPNKVKKGNKDKELVYTDDFLTFWDCYPKKVGKGGAFGAWNKARSKPPIADLVAAVERQSKSDQWKRDNGQYIPNPQTWLNQRRWEDGETDKPSPRYISPYMKKYLESLKK